MNGDIIVVSGSDMWMYEDLIKTVDSLDVLEDCDEPLIVETPNADHLRDS